MVTRTAPPVWYLENLDRFEAVPFTFMIDFRQYHKHDSGIIVVFQNIW